MKDNETIEDNGGNVWRNLRKRKQVFDSWSLVFLVLKMGKIKHFKMVFNYNLFHLFQKASE